MNDAGLRLRLDRLFPRGRTVMVALDHGLFMGARGGPAALPELAGRMLAAGADALILSPGGAVAAADHMRGAPLVVRVDMAVGHADPRDAVPRPVITPEGACRLGADALLAMAPFGWGRASEEPAALERLGLLIDRAHGLGLPVIVECLPSSVPSLVDACRIAAELGADVVKAAYPDDAGELRELIEGCPRPVVLAGGPKVPDEASLLQQVARAMGAGAVGVAFGRNAWGHPEPEGFVARLCRAVHGASEGEVDQ
ncbi:class I fructose-bisphosphate aldolase [Limnochorda pilosa]|uniref:Fructose-bisphosphate aldolase n=1 Tax=Limnochorda pilosa TaxID=1555112 RepID=A0A0K2SLH9_LIMPI|nr:hypothetical protein [Limnochorda pilosa]BAS27981.1 fructose-bisphosphate aldolase [Limnochorda pilosa]